MQDTGVIEMIHGMVYTIAEEDGNDMETTRVFTNGRSQAVRIPKAYRFSENEIYINKVGDSVILTPKSSLKKAFFEGIDMLTDDFLADGLPESMDSQREAL